MKATQVVHKGAFALGAALLTLGLASVCVAGNPGPNPGVLPPNANAQGHGYSGWSAEWFKWFLSIPTSMSMHPALDSTGDFCAEGQSGKVFYLASNFVTTDTVPCTVPTGKSIFFAIANVECSTVEPPPFFGSTEQELRDCARCWADHIVPSSLGVTVDGQPVFLPASDRTFVALQVPGNFLPGIQSFACRSFRRSGRQWRLDHTHKRIERKRCRTVNKSYTIQTPHSIKRANGQRRAFRGCPCLSLAVQSTSPHCR